MPATHRQLYLAAYDIRDDRRRVGALKPLTDARRSVAAALAGLTDPAALPDVAALRGIEGAAARAHFSGLAAVLPPSLGFTGRNRRPPRDPANACLSLAYTLLHAEATGVAHAAGLDPLLGFYHRPAFGRESLASDLIEPLRAEVDLWVWTLFRDRDLREDHFTFDKGACLLGKAGRQGFYAAWSAQVKPLRRWLRLRCAALARTLRDEGMGLIDTDPEEEEAT